jgi:hypothetical protein
MYSRCWILAVVCTIIVVVCSGSSDHLHDENHLRQANGTEIKADHSSSSNPEISNNELIDSAALDEVHDGNSDFYFKSNDAPSAYDAESIDEPIINNNNMIIQQGTWRRMLTLPSRASKKLIIGFIMLLLSNNAIMPANAGPLYALVTYAACQGYLMVCLASAVTQQDRDQCIVACASCLGGVIGVGFLPTP